MSLLVGAFHVSVEGKKEGISYLLLLYCTPVYSSIDMRVSVCVCVCEFVCVCVCVFVCVCVCACVLVCVLRLIEDACLLKAALVLCDILHSALFCYVML